MFSIWWPAFLLPLAMVLGGVAGGVLPGRKYRGPRGDQLLGFAPGGDAVTR